MHLTALDLWDSVVETVFADPTGANPPYPRSRQTVGWISRLPAPPLGALGLGGGSTSTCCLLAPSWSPSPWHDPLRSPGGKGEVAHDASSRRALLVAPLSSWERRGPTPYCLSSIIRTKQRFNGQGKEMKEIKELSSQPQEYIKILTSGRFAIRKF